MYHLSASKSVSSGLPGTRVYGDPPGGDRGASTPTRVSIPPGSGRQGRPIWAVSTLRATGMGSGRSGDLAGPWVVHINMARLSNKPQAMPQAYQTPAKRSGRRGGGPPFSKRGAASLLRISSDPPDPARISAPSRQSNASHHARPHRAQRGRARKAFKAHRSRRRRSFEQTQARVATYQHMDGRL